MLDRPVNSSVWLQSIDDSFRDRAGRRLSGGGLLFRHGAWPKWLGGHSNHLATALLGVNGGWCRFVVL